MAALSSVSFAPLSDATTGLADRLVATRAASCDLASPLTVEDMTVQASDETSPTKWHLGHTTWFFETFVLVPHLPGYRVFDDTFNYCFNSYYESLGTRQPRPLRGLMTRPSSDRVLAYRAQIDEALVRLVQPGIVSSSPVGQLIELGIQHEQQHQELLLTDILALFAASPARPAYCERPLAVSMAAPEPVRWIDYAGGISRIGHDGAAFAWDNERPNHDALIHPFRLADRLVTNGEWCAFIADKGYQTASLWLADGWTKVRGEGWQAPLHWFFEQDHWRAMTLHGMRELEPAAPVAHISYFEADAFARWAGCRLPTEFEWEIAAATAEPDGGGAIPRRLRPEPAAGTFAGSPRQMFGDVWQWTQSAYLPYPGYRAPAGALGEYNGKFMVSQHVLRGSSFATPPGHARATYRNFFYPHQRWQFTGLRLAKECA